MAGKEGLFRSTIFGKRINKSGRTVIIADPFTPVHQIRLPLEILDCMRPLVKVTWTNINALRDIPLFTKDGTPVDEILPGSEYYRLYDPAIDQVCINRQPSLWKYAIMSFTALPTEHNVIKINPCITTAFNADFDGDEMNVFLIDSEQSKSEVSEILNIRNNAISDDGKAVIQPVQDTITGSYMMSMDKSYVPPLRFSNYYIYSDTDEHYKHCVNTHCASGILSLAFPSSLCLRADGVDIVDGVLKHGTLRKESLCLIMKHVSDACLFLTKLQQIVVLWLSHRGLSTSITDCISDKTIDFSSLDINDLDEDGVKYRINQFREQYNTDGISSLDKMIQSGAKGQSLNRIQIRHYLGQQYIGGNRISPLPYHTDNTLEYNGFIKSSYVNGLNPREYFFHQMAAREGVVNTGISTSETGYLSRRTIKLMSDIVISHDGSIVEGDSILRF
jgi:DNA-directed RNA polymerase beta' subunit